MIEETEGNSKAAISIDQPNSQLGSQGKDGPARQPVNSRNKSLTHPENNAASKKVGQEQIHSLLFGDKLSWQAIIYDLINTEQLDPWDIDLSVLANKYLEKVKELEEANLFVSSKVLFAASLLLRIKSEILLNHYIPSLDDILFGRKEERKYIQERIELDEQVPVLMQRTPLPRFRKVTLEELMSALGRAVNTENRRIQRVALERQQEIETAIAIPKKRINIRDSIKNVYKKLKNIFSSREDRVAFSEIAGDKKEDKISTFVPLLHLDTQEKVLLEQEGHLDEIWIWLKSLYEKKNGDKLEKMKKEVEIELVGERLEEEIKEEGKKVELAKERLEEKVGKEKRKVVGKIEKEKNAPNPTSSKFSAKK